jgi:hypothetical protein
MILLFFSLDFHGNKYFPNEDVRMHVIIAILCTGHVYIIVLLSHIILTAIKQLGHNNAWTAAYKMLFMFVLLLDMTFGFYFINLVFGLGLMRFSFLFGTLLVYYLFIVLFSFPEFTTGSFRIKANRAETLQGIDIQLSVNRLMNLMSVDHVYRNESLTQRPSCRDGKFIASAAFSHSYTAYGYRLLCLY